MAASYGPYANRASDPRPDRGYVTEQGRVVRGRRIGHRTTEDGEKVSSRTGQVIRESETPVMRAVQRERLKREAFDDFFADGPLAKQKLAAEVANFEPVMQPGQPEKDGRVRAAQAAAAAAAVPAVRPAVGPVTGGASTAVTGQGGAVSVPAGMAATEVSGSTEANTRVGKVIGTPKVDFSPRTKPGEIMGMPSNKWFSKHGDRMSHARMFGARFGT